MARVLKIESRAEPSKVWVPYASLALALVIGVSITIGAMHALQALDSMQADVHHMDTRLATLDSMDRKLDGLAGMSGTLNGLHGEFDLTTRQLLIANAELRVANRKLDTTNGKLGLTTASIGRMSGSLSKMQGDLSSLGEMRADIHTMVHKISGSFLFKGVK
jgi:hypothetical protein